MYNSTRERRDDACYKSVVSVNIHQAHLLCAGSSVPFTSRELPAEEEMRHWRKHVPREHRAAAPLLLLLSRRLSCHPPYMPV